MVLQSVCVATRAQPSMKFCTVHKKRVVLIIHAFCLPVVYVPCRLMSKVREQGMQDVLPETLRQQHGLGSWLDDLEEAHNPTTRPRYEQACRGLAMRVSHQQLAVAVSVVALEAL